MLARLTSAPSIDLVTAAWLLVGTLNFTPCASPESRAAYAGLTPTLHESGRSVRGRPRIGHDGNGRLRSALHMATLNATQHNPAIRRSTPDCAPLAAAQKLAHLAWALGNRLRRFDLDYQQHAASPELAA